MGKNIIDDIYTDDVYKIRFMIDNFNFCQLRFDCLDKNYIKIANQEPIFIPVKSRFQMPIIDEEDIIFTQPYRKVITIELPDQTCVRRNVDLRSPTENVVKELCFHFKIHPYEIWGAYYDARGENILIIPNQSISEQVPDIQRIYLKQYLFPENLKPDYLSPFNMYIFQYRAMIIQGQFGNDPEDFSPFINYLCKYDYCNIINFLLINKNIDLNERKISKLVFLILLKYIFYMKFILTNFHIVNNIAFH